MSEPQRLTITTTTVLFIAYGLAYWLGASPAVLAWVSLFTVFASLVLGELHDIRDSVRRLHDETTSMAVDLAHVSRQIAVITEVEEALQQHREKVRQSWEISE